MLQMTLSIQIVGKFTKLNLLPLRAPLSVFYYRNSSSNKRRRKLTNIPVTMPKSHGETTTKDKLRHVRYREQIGGKLPVPGKIELQVIGSGGRGTPQSVILATDHVGYLFNCGEGTQRIATEHKIKLSRLENIFITHNSWDNIGGLLGLALTVEGINVPKITIHGPAMVEQCIRMAKTFAESSNIQIDKREVEMQAYEDSAFRIEYVPIHHISNTRNRSSMTSDSFMSSPPRNVGGIEDYDDVPAKRMRFSPEKEMRSAVAYICKPHAAKRRLVFEKCVDLGVPVGPLLGCLKNEEPIELDDGTVITPDQVLSPAEKPYPIVILECPSLAYLDSLVNSEQLNSLQGKEEDTDLPAELVVHMSPFEVMDHPKYQQWIKSFGSETKHLILNERTSGIANLGLFKIQTMLNVLSPSIFPLLHHQKVQLGKKNSLDSAQNGHPDSNEKNNPMLQLGCTNLKYHLRPRKGFNEEQCLYLDNEAYIKEARTMEGFEEQLEIFNTKVKELTKDQDPNVASYPKILFLGTGSSVPSKRRNVSGILLQTEPDTCILLDCGEGTAGQLYRHYGDEETANILCNLKAIFISHMHADHHMGLFGILRDRMKVMKKRGKILSPILLLSPIQINRWLNFYARNIEDIQHLSQLIPLHMILPHQIKKNAELYFDILQKLNLVECVPVEVDHCKNAYGVCLSHSSNWKIVYSGDTMPCERLVTAGKKCDLLIHEATMEDDLEDEAKMKTHSTTSQAIDIGMRMEAKFILLNHFSQRYSKIPIISENFSEKVGISFDNMRLKFSDLPLLPHLNKPLKTLFADEYAEMEEKIAKRTLRKQLENTESPALEVPLPKQMANV